MAHTPHTYSTGDTITAALLNQAEADLAAAIPKADADAAYDAKGAATAAQAAAVQRANHTGTQSADSLVDGTTNKAYTAAEKTKLSGVATAATANATDVALRDRSTHTGTQAASTVTGLSTVATSGAYTDLSGKPTIPAAYTDAQAVAANASAIAGKAPQLVPTATKTAAYTAAVGDLAVMNVAGGATALTLPTAPADKSTVGFLAVGATTATPLTVNRGGTDTLGPAGATSVTAVLANEVTVYQYDAANTRWLAVGNVKPQTALDARYAGQVTDAAMAGALGATTGAAIAGRAELKAGYVALSKAGQEANLTQNLTALRPFHAALSNAANAPCNILCLGDSIGEGQGATALTDRYMQQVLTRLRAQYQPSGVAGGIGFLPPAFASSTLTAPSTFAGAPTTFASLGLGGRVRRLQSAGQSIAWTVSGTSADIVWAQGPTAGSFSWSLDGGAATTVSTTGGTAVTDHFTTRVTFGTRGSHTVTAAFVSGSTYIDGIVVYDQDETAGIRMYDGSHFGWETGDYATNLATSSGQLPLRDQVAAISPALVIIELGTNDFLHNKTSASMLTNLNTVIGQVRAGATKAGTPQPSILLAPPWLCNYTSFIEPYSNYLAQLYSLAASDASIAIHDQSLRMPQVSGDTLGLYYDAFHALPKGQRMQANYLAGYLNPR